MAYVQQTAACNLPNSETPMSADAIARQDRFVAAVGKKFTDGNDAMGGVIAMLTPPPPVGNCDDFTSSLSMSNITPFPWPIPAAAGVNRNAPSLSGGAGPAGSSQAPADAFAKLSKGWQWANAGGGSTYPWGQTQLRASRLIPPWVCTPVPGGPGSGDGAPSDLTTAMTWAKWLAGGAALALVIAASRKGKTR